MMTSLDAFLRSPHRKALPAVIALIASIALYQIYGWPPSEDETPAPVVAVQQAPAPDAASSSGVRYYKDSVNSRGEKDPTFDRNILVLLDNSSQNLDAAQRNLEDNKGLAKLCVSKKGRSVPKACTELTTHIRTAVFEVARAENLVDTYTKNGRVADPTLRKLQDRIVATTTFHKSYPGVGPQLTVNGLSD